MTWPEQEGLLPRISPVASDAQSIVRAIIRIDRYLRDQAEAAQQVSTATAPSQQMVEAEDTPAYSMLALAARVQRLEREVFSSLLQEDEDSVLREDETRLLLSGRRLILEVMSMKRAVMSSLLLEDGSSRLLMESNEWLLREQWN